MSLTDTSIHSIHFVGVGGVGMSGIALVAHDRGYHVSGSDLKASKTSAKLEKAGLEIHVGHDASYVTEGKPDVVVISSAVPQTNPEVKAALELGIPIWQRAQMLSYLGKGLKTVAVAGTHGKTTTSSMLATTLDKLGAKPTFLIGGTVDGYDTNAVAQDGEFYVVEADESDGSFIHLDPYVAVVTNIEADHLDHYSGIEEIYDAFLEFMSRVPSEGAVIVCGDDPNLVELAKKSGRKVLTYGFGKDNDTVCSLMEGGSGGTYFKVSLPSQQTVAVCLRSNPGIHNVLNASAVLTAANYLGYPAEDSAKALSSFSGVRRRFDPVANVAGVQIIDDYGHHPTEIAATLAAAKTLGYKHIHVLFQPHRYSRTQLLAKEFGCAFKDADTVTFMDVYSAGESPIPGVSGKTLVRSVLDFDSTAQVAYMPHSAEIVPYLVGKLRAGDLLITLGAGDVTTFGPLIAKALEGKANN